MLGRLLKALRIKGLQRTIRVLEKQGDRWNVFIHQIALAKEYRRTNPRKARAVLEGVYRASNNKGYEDIHADSALLLAWLLYNVEHNFAEALAYSEKAIGTLKGTTGLIKTVRAGQQLVVATRSPLEATLRSLYCEVLRHWVIRALHSLGRDDETAQQLDSLWTSLGTYTTKLEQPDFHIPPITGGLRSVLSAFMDQPIPDDETSWLKFFEDLEKLQFEVQDAIHKVESL